MKWIGAFAMLLLVISGAMLLLAETVPRAAPVVPPITQYEGRLLELERHAIEMAFENRITRLFDVWMQDDRGQPDRALTGAAQARKAFVGSMDALERRERAYKATLPPP